MKQKINKLITYASKKENYGKVLLGILVIIFLVFTAIYLLGSGHVSKIERNKIDKESAKYINYIEDITESKSKDIDKYIIFALDYYKNNNNMFEVSAKDITKFLNKNLNIDIKKEKVISIGITDEMRSRNITYDSSKETYKVNVSAISGQSIKERGIVYYKEKKIRKRNINTYEIKYDKYVISNPYDLLNYYIDKDTKITDEDKYIDITPIKNYLMGSSNIDKVKEIIKNNEKDLKAYSKKKGSVKIIYKMKGNKLVIDKIK